MGGGDPARHERPEIDEVPAVQRNFLDGALRHHLAYRDRPGLDDRGRADDGDILGERRDAEPQVDDDRLRDAEIDLPLLILEALQMCDHLVVTRPQRGGDVLSGGAAHDGPLDAGRGIAGDDGHAGHDGALRIGHRALKSRSGLRCSDPRARHQQREDEEHPSLGPEQCAHQSSSRRAHEYIG